MERGDIMNSCLIGVEYMDKSVVLTYCSSGGGDYNAEMLMEHYEHFAKALKLVRGGDIYELGKTIDETTYHKVDGCAITGCLKVREADSIEEFFQKNGDYWDTIYLFREQGWVEVQAVTCPPPLIPKEWVHVPGKESQCECNAQHDETTHECNEDATVHEDAELAPCDYYDDASGRGMCRNTRLSGCYCPYRLGYGQRQCNEFTGERNPNDDAVFPDSLCPSCHTKSKVRQEKDRNCMFDTHYGSRTSQQQKQEMEQQNLFHDLCQKPVERNVAEILVHVQRIANRIAHKFLYEEDA